MLTYFTVSHSNDTRIAVFEATVRCRRRDFPSDHTKRVCRSDLSLRVQTLENTVAIQSQRLTAETARGIESLVLRQNVPFHKHNSALSKEKLAKENSCQSERLEHLVRCSRVQLCLDPNNADESTDSMETLNNTPKLMHIIVIQKPRDIPTHLGRVS